MKIIIAGKKFFKKLTAQLGRIEQSLARVEEAVQPSPKPRVTFKIGPIREQHKEK